MRRMGRMGNENEKGNGDERAVELKKIRRSERGQW